VSIAARTATGAAWQLTAGVGVRAIGLVGTIILTHFLSPSSYGEVMLASACVLFAMRTLSTGPSAYVIACRTSREESFQALLLQVTTTVLGLSLLVLFREPLASALAAPGMARYIPGLAVAGLAAQVSSVPAATLTRDLRFGVPAIARIVGEGAYTVTAVGLVPFLGASAIVVGGVVRSALSSTVIMLRSEAPKWWAPVRPDWSAIRRQLAFSLPLTGSGLADTVSRYGDNLLVSRLYGPGVMGQYHLGFNMATTPNEYVAEYAGEVMLPGLAAVNDPERRRRAFLRILGILPLLVFPLAFGLAVTAPTAVAAFLDPRWAPVGPMITVLSGIAVARTIGSVTFPYLLSNRLSRPMLALALLRSVTLVLLMLTLGRLGPLWACAAATLAAVGTHITGLVWVSRSAGIQLLSLFGALSPPLWASALMVLSVLGVRTALSSSVSAPWLQLVAEIGTGAVTYVVGVRLLAPDRVADVVAVVRTVANRKSMKENPS
jgi:lipopolysaccharide exporter